MVLWCICRSIKKKRGGGGGGSTYPSKSIRFKNICVFTLGALRKCQAKQKAARQATEKNMEHALNLKPCYLLVILSFSPPSHEELTVLCLSDALETEHK